MKTILIAGIAAAGVMSMLALSSAASAQAAGTLTKLTYQGKDVNGYLGGNADFPREFVGNNLCEGGKASPDASSGCVLLNADGGGTWENDVSPGRRSRPVPITWHVIADQKGTVTRVGSAEADTYFVLFEFMADYDGAPKGTKRAFPARLIKLAPRRVVIDSKYRTID